MADSSDTVTSSPDGVNVVLLLSRKGGKNGVYFANPHHPNTETQRLHSLDWAPDGEFIKCNKWRQNASSCPWRLGMDLTDAGGTFDRVFGWTCSPLPLCAVHFSCSVIYHLQHTSAFRQTWSCAKCNCLILRGSKGQLSLTLIIPLK